MTLSKGSYIHKTQSGGKVEKDSINDAKLLVERRIWIEYAEKLYIRGERIVFWGPNTNTNSIRPKKNTEYEYEYYSSIFLYRIRIRIIFVKNFPTNTNTNTIRQKISTEYEYEYYSVWKYHRIRIRIISYSNIFEYIPIYSNIFKHRIIPSLMKSHAKKLFEILAFFVTFFPWKKKRWTI